MELTSSPVKKTLMSKFQKVKHWIPRTPSQCWPISTQLVMEDQLSTTRRTDGVFIYGSLKAMSCLFDLCTEMASSINQLDHVSLRYVLYPVSPN